VVNILKINGKLKSFYVIFCFVQYVNTQTTLVSWNLKDFGKSKSAVEINFIAPAHIQILLQLSDNLVIHLF
jgi:hypothetical protein